MTQNSNPRRALVVVDVQNEYETGGLRIQYPPVADSLRNIGHAMDHWIIVVFAYTWGVIAGVWGVEWTELTPFNYGAGLQETVTGLNALGALVIGLIGPWIDAVEHFPLGDVGAFDVRPLHDHARHIQRLDAHARGTVHRFAVRCGCGRSLVLFLKVGFTSIGYHPDLQTRIRSLLPQ